MDIVQKLHDMLSPALQDMGFEIVRIRLLGQKRMTLQIMADRMDDLPISVDDCAQISHVISALMDVDDPIEAAYSLEVSSPGIDRPLTRVKDFKKWQGFLVRIQLKWLQNGRKRFRGILQGVDADQTITIKDEAGAEFLLPFDQIEEAKLILDDHLLAFSRKQAESLGVLDGVEGAFLDANMGVNGDDEDSQQEN